MANMVIKKKLTLEFLGEEHADSYLTFRSVPVVEYDELIERIKGVDDGDNKSSTIVMLDILKQYFLDGVYGGDKVSKDDLNGLDGSLVVKCFETLTGRAITGDEAGAIDPKAESESSTESSTTPEPAQK